MSREFKPKVWNPLTSYGGHTSDYLKGIPYRAFLKRLHEVTAPEHYFEIGVDEGRTLALARCQAVGVDPSLKRLKWNQGIVGTSLIRHLFHRSASSLFEMTSDEFFATQDLQKLFPKGIDLAFLDGMHLFEFLLRDFVNTERLMRYDSVIVLHDCCPENSEMTEREHRMEARTDRLRKVMWTGDVWKLLPILRQYRPDLRQIVLDCTPTGLVLLTNLDPTSSVLRENSHDIIRRFTSLTLDDYGLDRLRTDFAPLDSRSLLSNQGIRDLLGRA